MEHREMPFGTALLRLAAAGKPAKGVSLYSRYVNRPLGRVLAAGCYRAGLGPHQVTVVSGALSFAAIAALALFPPSWPLGAAVYAALALGFAFDSADGQLARLLGRGSAAGEWLDHVVDCAKITALHAAVLISIYRFFELRSSAWLLLPLAFQFAALLIFFGGLLTAKLLSSVPADPSTSRPYSLIRALALVPVDYGVFCAVFLLLGSEPAFLGGYAFFFAAHAVLLCGFLAKWFNELSEADRAGDTGGGAGTDGCPDAGTDIGTETGAGSGAGPEVTRAS